MVKDIKDRVPQLIKSEDPLKKKICGRCRKDLFIEDFYKCKSNKNGLQNACKICNKSVVKKWQDDHRDEINARVDHGKRSEDMKLWYAKNKNEHKKNVMAYNKKHYNSDPMYRLTKEHYHMFYRYTKMYDVPKTAESFKMCGYSSEELKSYFKEKIDLIIQQGGKHKLSFVVLPKYFDENTPVDVIFSLLNLKVVDNKEKKDLTGCIYVGSELYQLIIPRYVRQYYWPSIVTSI